MGPMPRLLSEITSNGEAAFPWKLHRVLEESERCGFSDIVSWQGNRAFKVHDPKNFEKSIMKKYFNQTRYKSFQRQLNIYGFERITIGTDIGSYTHHLLVRGKPNICRFMVRTKVKNKGSKASTAHSNSTNGLSRTYHVPNKRRASTIGARSLPQHPQPLSKISRSISCPGATKITNEQFIPNQNISSLNNDVFQADPRKIQSLRLQNNIPDIGENNFRGFPSTTIDDGFSDDIFSSDSFEVDFHPVANVSVDGNSNNNSTGTNMGHRRNLPMPSLLLCDNSSQDDITVLGNSNRSTSTQASGMGFQQSQQPQLDPFHPRPIPEHELPQPQEHRLLQQKQMMEQQQQRREQECHMLEMQIQHLQNRIVSLNQHTQDLQTVPNNTNYLCNGVAAIEPNDRGTNDRGTVTPTTSPNEMGLHGSSCNNNNKSNHPLRQLERDSDPNELMSLNPTPIFTPLVPIEQDFGTMGGNCSNNNMRRSISFCSYPKMVTSNVP